MHLNARESNEDRRVGTSRKNMTPATNLKLVNHSQFSNFNYSNCTSKPTSMLLQNKEISIIKLA